MTITIHILDEAVRVSAGDSTATLDDPNPEALARRIAREIKDAAPTANVITLLPQVEETTPDEVAGAAIAVHEQQLLSPAEVASRLGVSRDVVYDHIRSGDLPTIRIGTGTRQLHRIAPDELARFINDRRA